MSYDGLRSVTSAAEPELGGNVHNGDPYSYAPSVWNYLAQRFAVRSVLDVGCGQGHAAAFFSKLGCTAIAVDGLEENLRSCVYPVILHDLRNGAFRASVDLVYSVELVEHIDEKYIDNLIATLTNGKLLMMTHATPGQDGHHHVNCQDYIYWAKHMSDRGFAIMEEDTRRIRALAAADNAAHCAKSALMFGRL